MDISILIYHTVRPSTLLRYYCDSENDSGNTIVYDSISIVNDSGHWNIFEKKFEFFFEKHNIFSTFFTRLIYIHIAVKSDSNHTTIVYYFKIIVIVNDSTIVLLFTIIYYHIGRSSDSLFLKLYHLKNIPFCFLVYFFSKNLAFGFEVCK